MRLYTINMCQVWKKASTRSWKKKSARSGRVLPLLSCRRSALEFVTQGGREGHLSTRLVSTVCTAVVYVYQQQQATAVCSYNIMLCFCIYSYSSWFLLLNPDDPPREGTLNDPDDFDESKETVDDAAVVFVCYGGNKPQPAGAGRGEPDGFAVFVMLLSSFASGEESLTGLPDWAGPGRAGRFVLFCDVAFLVSL